MDAERPVDGRQRHRLEDICRACGHREGFTKSIGIGIVGLEVYDRIVAKIPTRSVFSERKDGCDADLLGC
jgi:hypothetical protein